MYLQTLKPYRKPGSIHNEIDNLLHEFYGGPIHTGALAGEWLPAADITETEDRVFIKAELPGIEEKNIDLSICGNMLTTRKSNFAVIFIASVFVLCGMASDSGADDQGTLRYSRSAQIYEVFGKEGLNAFTIESGIKVESYTSSSASAVYRLMNDFSDIASTTRELYRRHRDYGYVQIPFCKDPIAILTNFLK